MYELEFTYGEEDIQYTAVFDIERGDYGDYFNPPTPPEVIDIEVYDEDGNKIDDRDIIYYAEEEAIERINEGDYDE